MSISGMSEFEVEGTLLDAMTVVVEGTALEVMGCSVRIGGARGEFGRGVSKWAGWFPGGGPGMTAAGVPNGGLGKRAAGAPDGGLGKTEALFCSSVVANVG